ncbi:pyridoxal phosphate-dependent decarboxylase family protein [Gemmatimonadota bacterium]
MHEETLDPHDWDAFRTLAHRMVDKMLDVQHSVRDRPAWRPVPDVADARFRDDRPVEGQGVEATYKDFLELVLPYPTGNDHPRFWGWAVGAGSPTGMMADMLAAGMNSVSGPFNDGAARLEKQVVNWMKAALGFPEDSSGLFTSGGSVANLIGLAVGRDARAGYDVSQHGVVSEKGKLVFYVSSEVHSSIFKSAMLLGLGQDAARIIPVDSEMQMIVPELETAIALDRAEGLRPFAVVGTAGTINTGAIDDLDAIASVATREEIWFHLDGAFGALAKLSPGMRALVSGLERADSLAFDFHKWMNVPYEAGCVLIRDGAAHRAAFTVHADYLKQLPRGTGAQTESTNLRSPQLSRGFKALKVWMMLKEHGFEKFGRLVAQNVEQARYLRDLVKKDPGLELMAPVALNVVPLRFAPTGVDPAVLDELNRELLMRIQEQGIAVPSSTYVRGHFTIRVCICNHRSRREDFDLFAREVVRIGNEILEEA